MLLILYIKGYILFVTIGHSISAATPPQIVPKPTPRSKVLPILYIKGCILFVTIGHSISAATPLPIAPKPAKKKGTRVIYFCMLQDSE